MTRSTSSHQGPQRDRAVRRAGRVRAALVGGATAAAVGLAGVLGLTTLTAGPASSASAPAQQPAADRSTKSSLIADLQSFGSGQPVSSGNGSSTHATTQGS